MDGACLTLFGSWFQSTVPECEKDCLPAFVRALGTKRPSETDKASAHKTVVAMSLPQHEQKNTWPGKQYRQIMMRSVSAVEDFFEDRDESFYTTGIQALQNRCKKCVDRRGENV